MTSRTRTRVGLFTLIALIVVGAPTLASYVPKKTCAEIKKWVQGNYGSIPKTVAGLGALPMEYRRVVALQLTPSDMSSVWREYIRESWRRPLTQAQRQLLGEVYGLISPEFMAARKLPKDVHERLKVHLGKDSEAGMFVQKLGPPEGALLNLRAVEIRIAKLAHKLAVHAAPEECNCNWGDTCGPSCHCCEIVECTVAWCGWAPWTYCYGVWRPNH
jgi:hypothetical protein